MKKLATLFSAAILGASALMAGTVNADFSQPLRYEIDPVAMQNVRTQFAKARLTGKMDNGEIMTRRYTDEDGKVVWDLEVMLSDQKVCDMVKFQDGNGQSVSYPFANLPYYVADFRISKLYEGDSYAATDISFVMCWPSYYVWEQIYTYDGELDEYGGIPVDKRNYAPVSMTDLCNSTEFAHKFKEIDSINAVGNTLVDEDNKFDFFTLLENVYDANGGLCTYEGKVAQTYITQTINSEIDFRSFNAEDSNTSAQLKIYVKEVETGVNRNLRKTYDGPARIEGFEPINQTLPNFGNLHIFNAGLTGSDILGDANPFTGSWGPFTELYFAIGDEHVEWTVDPTATAFAKNVIQQTGINADSSIDYNMYASMLNGTVFADAKYANDTTLDPSDIEFYLIEPLTIEDLDNNSVVYEITPALNSFVPYGANESWSNDYGTYAFDQNYMEALAEGSKFAIGTTEGFKMELKNHYKKTFSAVSTGDVIYHYNPKNVQEVRTYSLIGDYVWGSGVETVAADKAAINVVNGAIEVAPAEAAQVAVYSLDGACLKSVKAAAGSVVEVKAPKGVYVVVVNGQSKKVIL